MLRQYYELIKPERTYANVMTALAGYLLASKWHIGWSALAGLLLGTTLIIGSADVCNNYLDRRLDAAMQRTRRRALVTGAISGPQALIYAACLVFLGFFLLSYTNRLTMLIGLIAFFSYVVVYGWAKRHTVHGTLVGTVPGAASIVAGYTAASDRLNLAALLLFLIMVTWQMAHFYAIAVYRLKDYRAAGLPVWPVVKGVPSARRQIIAYIIAFIAAAVLLNVFGYAGYCYLAVMVAMGLRWLWLAVAGFRQREAAQWARSAFLFSLIVLTALSAMLAVGKILP